MIQRIQTLFLLIAVTGNGLLFRFPLWIGEVFSEESTGWVEKVVLSIRELTLTTKLEGHENVSQTMIWMFVIVVVTTLIALISIFLFKKRALQMKLVRLAMLLETGFIALLFFYYVEEAKALLMDSGDMAISMDYAKPGIFLPIAVVVSLFFANRFIARDIRLLRSTERFR